MEAEYYSDKSIAVFGNTQPWKEDMKRLNGSFNKNLKGRPGWIFQRSKEAELMQFLANANAGSIQPTPAAAPAQLVAIGPTPMAMTPQTAMARLQTAQPLTLVPKAQPLPTIAPIIAQPLTPAPMTQLPTQPTTIAYPNLFTAADGLSYQIVLYTVPMPTIGQRVTLSLETGVSFNYTVTRVEKQSPPFDSIVITRVVEPADDQEEPNHSRAVLANGLWKIKGMQDEHTLTFNSGY